jgi:hypothetical protein
LEAARGVGAEREATAKVPRKKPWSSRATAVAAGEKCWLPVDFDVPSEIGLFYRWALSRVEQIE